MTTSYCCIFCLNTTKEEGNGNKLPPRFSLQQHHIRKQRHIVIILFFYAIAPSKKTTSHFRHLLLFKHKEDKTHKKTTKRKPKEGRELTFKLPLCFLTFGSRFYPSVSNAFSWHLLLLKQKKRKETI
jgi:hypothetical protein